MLKNPSDSLLAKIRNASKATGVTTEMAMRRYAHERLLNLLQSSPHANSFCLKGGVLLGALIENGHSRPTEDIDFNGMEGDKSIAHLEHVLREICQAHDGSDGLTFDVSTMKVMKDRDGAVPGGKIAMMAFIGKTRIPLRVDVGYGNAITPHVVMMDLPTLLPGLVPTNTVAVYPMETTIAEKLHAMHRHGGMNTRIKDYFDIWQLSSTYPFEGENLTAAISNTFSQHGDEVPEEFSALSEEFAASPSARRQWQNFTKTSKLAEDAALDDVVERIRNFVGPVLHSLHGGPQPADWSPDAGWEMAHAAKLA